VSGKTNFLVVGKDPGASKVSKASAKSIPLVDLLALNRVM
jgi:BRCT domain type II-containing protein